MKYKLYDLEVTVVGKATSFNCSHKVGDGLVFMGENMRLKQGTKHFSFYALSSLLPYVAAKQRVTDKNDWMYYESDIACPDPKCGAVFRFKRTGQSSYDYSPIT